MVCVLCSPAAEAMATFGDILVGCLSWEVTNKNCYSCSGTAGPRSSQGIPIRQIDCFLSSPPLIHVFHLSSNEPSAVWHHSGHLCIGPVPYCTYLMGNPNCTVLPIHTHTHTPLNTVAMCIAAFCLVLD